MINKKTLVDLNGVILEKGEIEKYEKETLDFNQKTQIQDNVKKLIVEQNFQEINDNIRNTLGQNEEILYKFKGRNINIVASQAITNAFSIVGGYGTDWATNSLISITNKKIIIVAANTMWGLFKLDSYNLNELEYLKTMGCNVYLKIKGHQEIHITVDNSADLKELEKLNKNDSLKNISISLNEKSLFARRNRINYISIAVVIALLIYFIQMAIK